MDSIKMAIELNNQALNQLIELRVQDMYYNTRLEHMQRLAVEMQSKVDAWLAEEVTMA